MQRAMRLEVGARTSYKCTGCDLDEHGGGARKLHLSLWLKRSRLCAADPDGGGSGGQLYEAACQVREALRGRAVLLIVDRTDIVDAAEADGVLLSPKGARPMTWGSTGKESLDSRAHNRPRTHCSIG